MEDASAKLGDLLPVSRGSGPVDSLPPLRLLNYETVRQSP